MPIRLCKDCGRDISMQHHLARSCLACSKSWGKKNGASAACSAVSSAIKRGDLPKASTCQCVDCGKQASDYDHRDYNHPLEVQPVCRSCNKFRGPAIPLSTQAQVAPILSREAIVTNARAAANRSQNVDVTNPHPANTAAHALWELSFQLAASEGDAV